MHLFAEHGGCIRLYLSLRPGFDSRVMSTWLNAILSARIFLSAKWMADNRVEKFMSRNQIWVNGTWGCVSDQKASNAVIPPV